MILWSQHCSFYSWTCFLCSYICLKAVLRYCRVAECYENVLFPVRHRLGVFQQRSKSHTFGCWWQQTGITISAFSLSPPATQLPNIHIYFFQTFISINPETFYVLHHTIHHPRSITENVHFYSGMSHYSTTTTKYFLCLLSDCFSFHLSFKSHLGFFVCTISCQVSCIPLPVLH